MSALGMAIVFLEGGPSPMPMWGLLSETNPRTVPLPKMGYRLTPLTDINPSCSTRTYCGPVSTAWRPCRVLLVDQVSP
jgi:hypothetical protein